MKNSEYLFVPYELAVKLKEKGFNEPCIAYYGKQDSMMGELIFNVYNGNPVDSEFSISKPNEIHLDVFAPLWQQVVDWFREKHDIIISVESTFAPKYDTRYSFRITGANLRSSSGHESYIDITTANHTFTRASSCKHPKHKTLPSLAVTYYEALNKAIEEALKLI